MPLTTRQYTRIIIANSSRHRELCTYMYQDHETAEYTLRSFPPPMKHNRLRIPCDSMLSIETPDGSLVLVAGLHFHHNDVVILTSEGIAVRPVFSRTSAPIKLFQYTVAHHSCLVAREPPYIMAV